jgi:hypothetical protein
MSSEGRERTARPLWQAHIQECTYSVLRAKARYQTCWVNSPTNQQR